MDLLAAHRIISGDKSGASEADGNSSHEPSRTSCWTSTVESSVQISGLSSSTGSTAGCPGLVQKSSNGNPSKWGVAGIKIMAANKVAAMFETLRDQKQVNELDSSRLKLVKDLGEGAFATVKLCELLPKLQPHRRPSLPTYLDKKSPTQRMEIAPKNASQLNRPFSLPAYPDKKSPAQQMEAVPKNRHYAKPWAGGRQLVAVKCIKPGTSQPIDDLDSFIQEAALTRKLNHKHIVGYVGIGFMDSNSGGSKQRSMFIAQEYMAGGTLRSMVSKQMLSPNRTVYTDK
ncbi:hypothetical protein DUNSADRAFT_12435 [Dunaliella salina]|uniref:Protein kinase domain-containing protein n=1 Tax=Dunaliella salina TaxID=3046 RepID=A0ABQ7H3S0_DUNSA|nr:hypothetical protein DUNSADRAFT_12435 [Dunaliella salina]|eukprot:KAF5841507.1 hypothetical protein DUNSADRAFT_12435 [Dunaliella salina]